MTRQKHRSTAPSAPGVRALLRPLRPGRNLTEEVMGRLEKEIGAGRLPPGTRLPTEQELMSAMGVSRTVVREAVAALRADGLITTRQGAGAYVAADVSRIPFRIDPDGLNSIDDVLEVMEVRLAIEVEAAALAAERITRRSAAAIGRALRGIEVAIAKGEGAVGEDFAFHLAIAEASGNARFAELLEFLGRHVIPRQSVRLAAIAPAEQRLYLTRIQSEHRHIHDAVCNCEPREARKAMRDHLTGSIRRYRRLAEGQPRSA